MSLDYIKIYGERNTGTNYLSRLIKLNLNTNELLGVAPRKIGKIQKKVPGNELIIDIYFYLTFPNNLGWKHSKVIVPSKLEKYKISSQTLFLTITKNPYSWLLSLYNRPYHQYYEEKPNFEDFLIRPWKNTLRDNSIHKYKNPIEIWNDKNRSYINLKKKFTALNITYENLLLKPTKIIKTINENLATEWDPSNFQNIKQSTNNNKTLSYYRSYYLNKEWRKELSDKAIKIINKHLDYNIMKYYKYKTVT